MSDGSGFGKTRLSVGEGGGDAETRSGGSGKLQVVDQPRGKLGAESAVLLWPEFETMSRRHEDWASRGGAEFSGKVQAKICVEPASWSAFFPTFELPRLEVGMSGAPLRIRTSNLLIRSQML